MKKRSTLLLLILAQHILFAQHLSTGLYHSFAICADGYVHAFGRNDAGQLGIGNTDNQFAPITINNFPDIVQAEAGGYFSVFRSLSGSVWVCGSNGYGNFGNGTTSAVTTTPQSTSLANIVDVDAGFGHTVVADESGYVYSSGWGNQGQNGSGSFSDNLSFTQMIGLTDVIDVEAGYWHSIMLKSDGTVWACGSNNLGQIGQPSSTPYSNAPIQIPGLSNIVDIAAGSYFSLFLDIDGNVFATGSNPNGQLGNGNNVTQYGVVAITGLPAIAQVIAGNEHSFFRTASGDLYGTGLSNFGQNGLNVSTNTPALLSAPGNVITAAAGGDGNSGQSLFMTSSGEMWGCGSNGLGTLGTTGPYIPSPTLITGLCGSFLPVAEFTANTTQNCLFPDPCFDFQNISQNASNVHWDFGDSGIPDSESLTFASACYGPGTYTVTLTAFNDFGSSTYSMDVTVYDLPEIQFPSASTELCVNDAPLVLIGAQPEGGEYSGPGVSDGLFDPSVAGVGDHEITYSLQTGPGCGVAANTTISVLPCTAPVADFDVSSAILCILDSCIDVFNLSMNADSFFWDLPGTAIGSANNIPLSQICFNTPGTHEITLTAYNAYDSASYSMNVVVYEVPEVQFTLQNDLLCLNFESSIPLAGGSPAGGVYSGFGVNGSDFDGTETGEGAFAVTYTYSTWGNCAASGVDTVYVEQCFSVEETLSSDSFRIYSLNADATILELDDPRWLGSTCAIHNSYGQILQEVKITDMRTLIPSSSFASGVVVVQLVGSNGQKASKSVVISRD